ncbi:MAG: DNA repair exonuclease [Dehalococcoidia bacterium]|nr:DNA repair exonuclease [Dehalococcoidia bacterium]
MKPVRFIHCADLHIDTPFKGISEKHPELKELLHQSTYQSFNNIVDLSIKERVDCIVIAGDIYDSEDKSLQAQLRFRNNLNRLSEAGIPTFIAYGNHDPLNGWSATLKWPKDVFVFPGDRVESFSLTKNAETIALVYGISFAKQDVTENLALRFPRVEKRLPTTGVLHTNIGTNTGHKNYAPCSIEDLSKSGIDYWALGHIHKHSILSSSKPAVVYSGCSQGTNPSEIGPRGCCLVTLESGNDPVVVFVATDTVRYKSDSLDISNCQDVDEVISSIANKCQKIANDMEIRHSIVRLALTGRTDLHKELLRGNRISEIKEEVRAYFTGNHPWIWLEKLILSTAGTYNLDSLRQANAFIADIISIFDELESAKSQNLAELREVLKPLFTKWQGSDYLKELTDEELLELANEARGQMLDELITD